MKTGSFPFSLFLALRYLKPKRAFLSIITLISVLGVTLGISLLIIVMSIMTGFGLELQKKVIGFEAHLVLGREGVFRDWREVTENVEKAQGVVATAPYVMGPVMVEFNHKRYAPKIRGIELEAEKKIGDMGRFIFPRDAALEDDQVILGSAVANSIGAQIGDTITLYSPGNMEELMDRLSELESAEGDRKEQVDRVRDIVVPRPLMVTGIFESGRYLYDSEFILVPLHIGQELYGLGDSVHGIGVKTADPYKAALTQKEIRKALDNEIFALTWMDLNQELFDAINMERGLMFFLMLCVSVVAGFCIMNTLITVTVLKTREVGIMKALGASNKQVVWVFLLQGMVVGFLGTVSGLLAGLLVIHQRAAIQKMLSVVFGIDVFPASVYEFSTIPAKVVPQDVFFICFCAFVICSLAAWLPAWVAARLDPVKALRYE